jgi:hypothetical protein
MRSQPITERDRDDERLSTDDAVHPEFGTRIGAVPGADDPVDTSGDPGEGTRYGAWPEGMGTYDDASDRPDEDQEAAPGGNHIGARHGQIAGSGVNTGPVGG